MTTTAAKGSPDLKTLKLGLDSVVGFVGFSLFITAVLGLYLYAPSFAVAAENTLYVRLICALTSMAVFALVFVSAHLISVHRCRMLLVGTSLGVVSYVTVMAAPLLDFSIAAVCLGVTSLGLSMLACLWFVCLCAQQGKVTMLFVSIGVSVGLALCLAEGFLDDSVLRVAVPTFYVLSFVCAIALVRLNADVALPTPISNKESDKRTKILWSSAIMLSLSCFQLGFVIETVAEFYQAMLCLLASAIAAVALAVDSVTCRVISERSLQPFNIAVTVLALMSLYLFDDVVFAVALCLLSMLVTVYMSFGWTALTEHVRICNLSPLRTYAKARMIDYAGWALGMVCGYGAHLLSASGLGGAQVAMAVAVAYCLVASFCNKPRFPDKGLSDDPGVAALEGKGLWRRRCRVVSEEYGLSERQYEVLVLVAQGRNAKYIEQALTISLSTAQTHIRNIYRKVGVHSRQELLNLIENTKLYGED